MTEQVSFRPHARLLTMLGEQLIRSDQIALVELVKNSYDADAQRVWVDFIGFGPQFETNADSTIVVMDDGSGMSSGTVRDAWMSPATPAKLRRKQQEAFTSRGRALQGEKGIGRFAAFKLGSHLTLSTREDGVSDETVLELDISVLDEDPLEFDASDQKVGEAGESGPEVGGLAPTAEVELFLDEIRATLSRRSPRDFEQEPPGSHGTRIEIGKIRSRWNRAKVDRAYNDLARLQPLMWISSTVEEAREAATPGRPKIDFEVRFLKDGVDLRLQEGHSDHFQSVLDRAVLKVRDGHVDTENREIRFTLDDRLVELPLDGAEIRGLRPFRDRFLKPNDEALPLFECGSFGFEFYVFDFSALAPAQHQLDKSDKEMLREHRVYLYRDGVRVYPYGDADDDWLQIDVMRGTQSARSMFSNDQTVGFVTITQAENPRLRDKTSREGLLDLGASTGDFVALIQTVLAYLRSKPYEQYAASNRRAREHKRPPREVVDQNLDALRKAKLDSRASKALEQLAIAVATERDVAQAQVARTQDLAGVGLSVETASHDLIAAGSEALRLARLVVAELRALGLAGDHVFELASSLVQRLEFVDGRFQDVQGLFVSTRQKRGVVDILQQVRKVRSMYSALHNAKNIKFEISETAKLKAETTEAAVLQALINIVDNATYWLLAAPSDYTKVIRVSVPSDGLLAISDSGPGVQPSDEPFIFEPFYSGKGDAGKGLGLYIAREVAARNGFSVELAGDVFESSLGGASFTLEFEKVVS